MFDHANECKNDLVSILKSELAAKDKEIERLKVYEELEKNCWDLRCVNVPTGGDDYDIRWLVIEHYMDAPHDREFGTGGRTPAEAIKAALDAGKAESEAQNG